MNYIFYTRLLIGISVMVVLFYAFDLKEFAELKQISFSYLVIAGVLILVDRVTNVVRWSMLINIQSSGISFFEVMSIYFKSGFLGLIMPSAVGGEFLKGYGLIKSGARPIESFSSVLMERMLGMIALLCTCGGGFFLFQNQLEAIPNNGARNILFTTLILVLMTPSLGYLVWWLFGGLVKRNSKITTVLREMRKSVSYYQQMKLKLSVALFVSFIIQVIRIYFTWFVGLGVGITLEIPYYFLFVPLISLVSMLPVSIAGLGIQEGAFVYFFSLTGTNLTMILAMALLVRILVTASILPGGILFIRDGMGAMPKSDEVKNLRE